MVRPNFNVEADAGACLIQAQNVVGAPGGPYSATQAGNGTQYQHYDRNFPTDAIAVVWFWHWGTYWNYIERRWTTEDYGHVVITSPDAFGIGQRGFYSSPPNGYGGAWYRTIEEVEATFNSEYRMWTEDLNGVRVCEPIGGSAPSIPSTGGKPKEWYEMLKPFNIKSARTKDQVITGNGERAYVTYRNEWAADLSDRTLVRGPGHVVGSHFNIGGKADPGTRVVFELVKETGNNKGRVRIAGPVRATADTFGAIGVQIGYSGLLAKGELVRLLVQVQKGKKLTVTEFYWNGETA